MNGLENAQHDLSDAQFCLETAIDLLSSIDEDTREPELHTVVEHLLSIKTELANSYEQLRGVTEKIEL